MTPAQERALEWLANGRTGSSSKTMANWLAFGVRTRHRDHPYDPADFDRCLGFLEAVPEARPHIHRMSQLSDRWARLAEHWDEIEQTFLAEAGLHWTKAKRAPVTYELMQRVLRPNTQVQPRREAASAATRC